MRGAARRRHLLRRAAELTAKVAHVVFVRETAWAATQVSSPTYEERRPLAM